jgi:hypothetical protein
MPPRNKAAVKGPAKPCKVTLKEKSASMPTEEWVAVRARCAVVTVDRKRHRDIVVDGSNAVKM